MEALEQIVPLIFLAIWVISAIVGKKKKRPRAPANQRDSKQQMRRDQGRGFAPPGKGFLERIRETFQELSRELQEPQTQLPEALKDLLAAQDAADAKAAGIERKKKAAASSTSNEIARLMQTVAPKHAPVKKPSAILQQLHLSKSSLKQAVIWSEIIGPPVSLREPALYD